MTIKALNLENSNFKSSTKKRVFYLAGYFWMYPKSKYFIIGGLSTKTKEACVLP